MEKERKRGLVLVFDPHNLLQFCWYYKAYKSDQQWDALCLPNGPHKKYMSTYCKQSQIFDRVISSDAVSFEQLGKKEQIIIGLKMFLHWITGQRKRFCKKLLNQYVGNIDIYDELVVIAEVGVLTGACIALSKEKKYYNIR